MQTENQTLFLYLIFRRIGKIKNLYCILVCGTKENVSITLRKSWVGKGVVCIFYLEVHFII